MPDGLDTAEYVEHLERDFDVCIPDSAGEHVHTLADLCRYLSDQRTKAGRPLPDREIWIRVRRITSHAFGIRGSELHPGIRFVDDLGC